MNGNSIDLNYIKKSISDSTLDSIDDICQQPNISKDLKF